MNLPLALVIFARKPLEKFVIPICSAKPLTRPLLFSSVDINFLLSFRALGRVLVNHETQLMAGGSEEDCASKGVMNM